MSSHQRQQPSRNSGHELQTGLISTATSLFAVNGFTGTTTEQIAKAAGVSEALLFKYFPTKHALYTAITAGKAQYSELREAIEEATKKREDERLFTLLASYRLRKGADPTMLRLLLFSALEGHEMSHMFFQRQYRVFHDLLVSYIRRRIEDGAFRQSLLRYHPPPSATSRCPQVTHTPMKDRWSNMFLFSSVGSSGDCRTRS